MRREEKADKNVTYFSEEENVISATAICFPKGILKSY